MGVPSLRPVAEGLRGPRLKVLPLLTALPHRLRLPIAHKRVRVPSHVHLQRHVRMPRVEAFDRMDNVALSDKAVRSLTAGDKVRLDA